MMQQAFFFSLLFCLKNSFIGIETLVLDFQRKQVINNQVKNCIAACIFINCI